MKNVLLLLLVLGAVLAGWINREQLMARFNPAAEEAEAVEEGRAPVTGAGTPHPAKEARLAASAAYPALAIPNSPFNKKFLALYADAQHAEPQLLAQSNWPLKLAERTAVALGGAPMPVPPTPGKLRPGPLPGSALDKRPSK